MICKYRGITLMMAFWLAMYGMASLKAQELGAPPPIYYGQQPPPTPNPYQVGMLRWYHALHPSVAEALVRGQDGGAVTLAFDGHHVWAAGQTIRAYDNLGFADNFPYATAADGQLPGKAHRIVCIPDAAFVTIPSRGSIVRAISRTITNPYGVLVQNIHKTEVIIGGSPSGIAFDGKSLWVADYNGGQIVKLTVDLTVLGRFPSGGNAPTGVAFDGMNIWVTNTMSNTVAKISQFGKLINVFPTGSVPEAITFDGANMWVTSRGQGGIVKIRAADGINVGTYTTGVAPTDVLFDGTSIWVSNGGSRSVTKLRASDGAYIATFAMPDVPYGLAFDGITVFVARQSTYFPFWKM